MGCSGADGGGNTVVDGGDNLGYRAVSSPVWGLRREVGSGGGDWQLCGPLTSAAI